MEIREIKETSSNEIEEAFQKDGSFILNYEEAKVHLMIQMVQTEMHRDLLEKVPHKEVADMAAIFRFDLEVGDSERELVLLTNEMLADWEITEEQLLADAIKYAPMSHPCNIRNLSEILGEMQGVVYVKTGTGPEIYAATIEGDTLGAGVMVYPDFMDKASEVVGASCIIQV